MVVRRSHSLLYTIARIVIVVLFFLFCLLTALEIELDIRFLSVLVLMMSVSEVLIMIYNKYVYDSGFTIIFFAYTLLVHNGFIIACIFDEGYKTFQSPASMSFIQNPYYNKAILISNIVMAAFVLSSEIHKKNAISYSNKFIWGKMVEDNKKEASGDKIADLIGLCLLGFGCFYLGYIVFSKGLWMQGYVNSLNVLEDNSFYRLMVVITSLSVALLFSAGTKKGVWLGSVIYLVIALLHFSIGNRGEVLYAAVVCFSLYSVRFKTIKWKHIVMAGMGVVILIPLIRIAREMRLDAYTLNPFTSFLDVLCEEGLQISPFTYTVQYVETGNGHAFGMTYVNDFVSFILRKIGLSSPFAVEKNIITEIMPYKNLAYSMVAELYYNFGIIISFLIYGVIGQCLMRFDEKIFLGKLTTKKKIFYSMIMVEMINMTRNDASTLPIYLAFTIAFYFLYIFVSSAVSREG